MGFVLQKAWFCHWKRPFWGFFGVLLQDFTKMQNLMSLNISVLQLILYVFAFLRFAFLQWMDVQTKQWLHYLKFFSFLRFFMMLWSKFNKKIRYTLGLSQIIPIFALNFKQITIRIIPLWKHSGKPIDLNGGHFCTLDESFFCFPIFTSLCKQTYRSI